MTALHRDIVELAASAIDFDLSAGERARLDDHLATCDACRRRVAGLHADDRVLVSLPAFAVGRPLRAGSEPRRGFADLGTLRLVVIGALLALLAVASLAVGAELLRRESDDRLVVVPVEPTPTPTETSPDPAVVPPLVLPSPLPDEWRSYGAVPAFTGAEVQVVSAAMIGEVLALGCTLAADGSCAAPVVWRSTDGIEWSEPVVLPLEPGEQGFRLTTLERVAPGRLLVGGAVARGDVFHAAIWTSDDGVRWTRAAGDPSFTAAVVTAFIEWDEEVVALGSGLFTEFGGFRAWRSTNGATWEAVSGLPEDDGAFPLGVIAPEEALLAWGPLGSVAPPGTAWWASSDGDAWARIDPPRGLEGADVRSIAGTVALGWTDTEPALPGRWIRPLVTEWTAEPADPQAAPINDQIAVGEGTVGAGPLEADGSVTVLWSRAPGESAWRETVRIPAMESPFLVHVVHRPGFVLAIGRSGTGDMVTWGGRVDWDLLADSPAPP